MTTRVNKFIEKLVVDRITFLQKCIYGNLS